MRATVAGILCLLSACGENLTPPPDHLPYGDGGDVPPLECVPNLDGQIEATELQAALGVPVTYLVSPPGEQRPVDVAGTVDGSGRHVWDWSARAATDRVAKLAAAPLAGAWFEGSVPGGQFTAPVDAAATLEGVYAHDAQGLWLLGIASAQADPPEGRTLLVYQRPVALYRFPLVPGAQWVAVGEVQDGRVRGLPYAGRDTYEVTVDAAGTLELPDLSFTQALRVRTSLTAEPAVGASTLQRQVSFLFECFGEVARATSLANEPEQDFTTAAEVRRLGL